MKREWNERSEWKGSSFKQAMLMLMPSSIAASGSEINRRSKIEKPFFWLLQTSQDELEKESRLTCFSVSSLDTQSVTGRVENEKTRLEAFSWAWDGLLRAETNRCKLQCSTSCLSVSMNERICFLPWRNVRCLHVFASKNQLLRSRKFTKRHSCALYQAGEPRRGRCRVWEDPDWDLNSRDYSIESDDIVSCAPKVLLSAIIVVCSIRGDLLISTAVITRSGHPAPTLHPANLRQWPK